MASRNLEFPGRFPTKLIDKVKLTVFWSNLTYLERGFYPVQELSTPEKRQL